MTFGFGRKWLTSFVSVSAENKMIFSAPVSFSAENVYIGFGRSLINVNAPLVTVSTCELYMSYTTLIVVSLWRAVQEIVKAIVNTGQQFTEQQYVMVLSLSHRSEYGSTDAELESRLAKLNAILTANASGSLTPADHTNAMP